MPLVWYQRSHLVCRNPTDTIYKETWQKNVG